MSETVWEIIAHNLKKASRSLGWVQLSIDGRTIWVADAHRGDGKRYVVRAMKSFLRFWNSNRRFAPLLVNIKTTITTVSGCSSDWLGRIRIRLIHWHLEFFPASFLLVGRNILDVGGNPPNVAAGVFDAAVPFTRRQCHDGKNRNSA